MERLGWALLLLLLIVALHQGLRYVQWRRLRRHAPAARHGESTLTVVVSSRCAICPAQKGVVAQLSQRYPSLRVEMLDAELQMEQVRKLSVMTVPTTLLQAADGRVVQINNGFIALEPLATQVERLLRQ